MGSGEGFGGESGGGECGKNYGGFEWGWGESGSWGGGLECGNVVVAGGNGGRLERGARVGRGNDHERRGTGFVREMAHVESRNIVLN